MRKLVDEYSKCKCMVDVSVKATLGNVKVAIVDIYLNKSNPNLIPSNNEK